MKRWSWNLRKLAEFQSIYGINPGPQRTSKLLTLFELYAYGQDTIDEYAMFHELLPLQSCARSPVSTIQQPLVKGLSKVKQCTNPLLLIKWASFSVESIDYSLGKGAHVRCALTSPVATFYKLMAWRYLRTSYYLWYTRYSRTSEQSMPSNFYVAQNDSQKVSQARSPPGLVLISTFCFTSHLRETSRLAMNDSL